MTVTAKKAAKKSNRFSLAKKPFARASRFFLLFFPVTALDYDAKLPEFHVFLRTWTQDNDFFFLFLNFDTVLLN